MTYSSIVYTRINRKKLWILICLRQSHVLKRHLVSQTHTNYITKKYFINDLPIQNHILKLHDIFNT